VETPPDKVIWVGETFHGSIHYHGFSWQVTTNPKVRVVSKKVTENGTALKNQKLKMGWGFGKGH
jgi:hypothetical protein